MVEIQKEYETSEIKRQQQQQQQQQHHQIQNHQIQNQQQQPELIPTISELKKSSRVMFKNKTPEVPGKAIRTSNNNNFIVTKPETNLDEISQVNEINEVPTRDQEDEQPSL